ncbi:restriction endonuclease subunit S [Paraburkholderia sp. CNPSo 3076]|uniref:restriction endonuclease subunit S n=1 Tax=Paraburkholderia sp. CNPSo 3076 TaxID=2940936 RepID=UPI00224FE6AD|nr:restriction endonuclease subunit S [Paraburkholderia sp. CNPSo 3076]MCX5545458.1 restriction endonuclease subunit S [Paraburkholderia sp. CNPSo 3076]
MSSEWPQVRLGDLIEVRHGWPFRSELFFEEKTGEGIVVAVGNFRYTGGFRFDETATKEYRGEYPSDYKLEPGDILLVMTCQTAGGEILGIPARVPSDGRLYLHNQRLGKVVVKRTDEVLPDYLYWLFLSASFNQALVSTASGTKILHTSPSRICDFKFALPPISVQREVAATLWSLESRIDLLRQSNATLEAIAQALFKSWFVDFDPVRAKAEGRDLEGVDPETAALFSDGFEESALGLVPKGWTTGILGDLVFLRSDRTKPTAKTEALPYVPIESITSKLPFLEHCKSGTEANSSLTLFKEGDILFGAMRPYFHKVCMAPFDGVTRTTVFTLAPKYCNAAAYALFQMFQVSTIEYATQHSEGSTIPYAKWPNSMEKMPIVRPPDVLQEAFTRIAGSLIQRANSNIALSQTLAGVRDNLLPRLISGQLRLAEAEAILDDAA